MGDKIFAKAKRSFHDFQFRIFQGWSCQKCERTIQKKWIKINRFTDGSTGYEDLGGLEEDQKKQKKDTKEKKKRKSRKKIKTI